jgi:neopullulanase
LPALPKFNTSTPAVREFIWNVATQWIEFGIDGWRLDVPAEIDDDEFWREFRRRVKALNPEAYIVGEIWQESRRWLQGDQFDAVMNYPITLACLGFFGGHNLDLDETRKAGGYHGARPMDGVDFADVIDTVLSWYDPQITMAQLNLLDSHDTPRFITSVREDWSALKLAYLFLFTYPGAPCVYYGDEIGLTGGHDPECRRSFPWDKAQWNLDILAHVKKLAALRKAYPALRRGSYHRLYADREVYAFGRWLDQDRLVVALNTATVTKTIDIPVQPIGLAEGALGDAFTVDRRWPIVAGVLREVELPPRSGLVLI